MTEILEVETAIIGGGPAGLMAADSLSKAGYKVHIFEAKPTVARKFLMAGKSGLNLSKKQNTSDFLKAYRHDSITFESALLSFLPQDVENWCEGLGIKTFYGSSNRLFPKVMKASALLRAWLADLAIRNVTIHTRHFWKGCNKQHEHHFTRPEGDLIVKAQVTIFALGGKSWAKLGSNGNWEGAFDEMAIRRTDFQPSNCGFFCDFDEHFISRFAGLPVKNVRLTTGNHTIIGDFVITQTGIEGGALYPISWFLRECLTNQKAANLVVDLKPDWEIDKLIKRLSEEKGKQSFSNHLRKKAKLTGVKAGLLRAQHKQCNSFPPEKLAHYIKNLKLPVVSPRPMDEAISTAGGVLLSELTHSFMLKDWPGLFIAGEMLDFDAPTGGYLLNACLATGKAAGEGAAEYIKTIRQRP